MKLNYGRDGSRVLLKTNHGPVVLAVAIDAGWAKIIVRDLNRTEIERERKQAS